MGNCNNCETTRYCRKYYILFWVLKKITISCIFLLTTTRWSGMISLVSRYAERVPVAWDLTQRSEAAFGYGGQTAY